MFPNESSSDEISKINAFTQNSKENNVDVNDVPEQLAESQTTGFVFSNEVTSAATYLSVLLSFTFPTDQVPVSRDAIDRTNERGVPVNMAAVSLPSLYAQMKTKQQQQHALSWPSPYFPPAAMTILAGDCETGSLHPGADGSGIKQLNTGCGSCGCTHYHPNPSSKSEALCQVSLGKDGGKAGADPTSHLFSEAIFSASVISSSSCGTAEPPSLATSHGAEQGFNAMFASHHGSSSSNSLSICAQSHTTNFTTTTTTIMDVEPTHVSQANENPNNITTVSQHVINLSVEAVRGLLRDNLPSLDDGQSEEEEEGEEDKKITTGALSDQDNNIINVKIFPKNIDSGEIVEMWQPMNQDANDDINKVWSVTPFLNIPKSQGEGTTLPASAKNATVQGKTDGHPPPSFNTSNNVKNCVEGNESVSLLQIHLKDFYIDGPATNARWGIPPGLGLRGGGESSLNSGTSSWGTPPGGNSNNNNSNSTTGGWGGNNQGQGSTAAQSQWGNNNNVNRNSSSGGSSQGPSGQQNPSNTNKGTNPQSNQPSSQQTQQSQAPSSQQQQQQQQQQNGSTSWAQAAGKGLPASQPNTGSTSNNSSNNNNNPGSGNSGSSGTGGSVTNSNTGNNSTKQQLEQLNTMREALFSQDGWGGQFVNQDTGWDIPASPEPGVKDGVPVWKPNVNNGTDLWEANLRNGGQPPPSQTQKTPWGHTPTTNIGGTWGEDDDVGDSSNVWTGVPSNAGPGGATGQWGANSAGASGAAGKKDNDWTSGGGGSSWGDPRDPRADPRGMDPRDPRDPRNVGAMDPRDLRGDPRDTRGGMMDPRDHIRGVVDPMRGDVGMRDLRDIRGMGDIRSGDPMMRGDPRGISGRLNGGTTNEGMWGQPPQPPHHAPHHQQSQPPGKMVGPGGVTGGVGVNQWVGPPPKDMNMPGTGSKPSGWEEPSPPAQRRNIPNYDDGTSLWGNPAQQQSRMGGKVSHWKETPMSSIGRGSMQCPPGISHNRMPGSSSGNMKPDGGPLWAHAPRNGSWGDGPHDTVNSGWVDESKSGIGAVNSWNEPPLTPTSWGPKPKNSLNPGWVDGEMEASSWGHAPKQGPKPVTKDFIWSSKQFRILAEMGFKKEDVEAALRTTNMNLEDAIELLNQGRLNVEAWRRHEDHSPFDLAPSHPGAAFPGQRFNPVAQQMTFPPGPGVSNAPSLLNNMNNPNASLAASINNLSPAIVQKIIAQQPPPQQPPTQQQAPFNQAPRPPQNQPSTQQLRMLVQQIQMAVQAGYLNHQILNQPLAPQTLILLNQLLQQIKVLQQLMQQQAVVQVQPLKGGSSAVLHISVQITKTKQQIANLQNQIASQQAIYVKQQQQQQHHMTPQGPQSDFFKTNVHDPLSQLQTNFGELNIKEPPQPTYQGQQSRLNQWKLPSIGDKETDSANNEFSRAPGTTTKPSLQQSHSSPNINPLGLGQGDGTWSTVARSSSDGWPEPSGDGSGQPDSKDSWPVTPQPSSAAFTDLVPEFEPGKPWKGTQIKSIEDDPSITPGSVVRSPLSLVTIKDTEIFNASGSKTSPTVSSAVDTTMPPLSLPTLSSSTWSFNPPVSSAPSFTSPLGKLGGSKGTWGEGPPPTVVTSELWGAPTGKSRGPPPGLSNKNTSGNAGNNSGTGGSNSSNGWGSLASGVGSTGGINAAAVVSGGGGRSSSWGIQGTTAGSWGSTWLLLKNLTPQIDGSTLKTLCMQHGPLQSFHLYLNHSIALAKYSTREEANKAQGALNNCVLGNTTIFAEAPGDTDVHLILQHLGHGAQQAPPGGSSGGWNLRGGSTSVAPGASKGAPPSDTWAPGSSQLWNPTPSSGSLWGAAPLDTSGDQHRATPSSLNSFLPGDLLGGESM